MLRSGRLTTVKKPAKTTLSALVMFNALLCYFLMQWCIICFLSDSFLQQGHITLALYQLLFRRSGHTVNGMVLAFY